MSEEKRIDPERQAELDASKVTAGSRRGFASMDPAKRAEICSMGGKAAHAQRRAHEFTSDEAREAGRKGGRAISSRPGHMAAIGRMGGIAKGRNRAAQGG